MWLHNFFINFTQKRLRYKIVRYIRVTMTDVSIQNSVQNPPAKFSCKICAFNTSRNALFNTHLLTAKHKRLTLDDQTFARPPKNNPRMFVVVVSLINLNKAYINIRKHAYNMEIILKTPLLWNY